MAKCDIYKNINIEFKKFHDFCRKKEIYQKLICDGKTHMMGLTFNGHPLCRAENSKITICPEYFNEYVEKKRARDEKQKTTDGIIKMLETFKRQKICTFENFDEHFNKQEHSVMLIKEFMSKDKKMLIISGSHGIGKTHLAKAFQNRLIHFAKMIRKKVYCEFITAHEFYLLYFKNQSIESLSNFDLQQQIKQIETSDCIVIDDLGSEKYTDVEVFTLYFKEFVDKYQGKIIITTNLNQPDRLLRYGSKIASRLDDESVLVIMNGNDYRKSSNYFNEK